MGERVEPRTNARIPHLWTPQEADRRLPSLNELLGQLRSWGRRLTEVHSEIARLSEFWGAEFAASDHPDHELASRLERERTNLQARLEEAVDALNAEGIEVKDLSSGLVDFYALQDGEVVLLCWRSGEREVGFYHTLTGGFAGRRPLPGRLPSSDPPSG